jgi:parallel beta-helix repeat protein
VENVTIKGFQISDTPYSRVVESVYSPGDAAIWLSGARRCVIENNRVINVGGYGLRLADRSANNEFIGNEVAYAGQGGVIAMLDVLGYDQRPEWWGWYTWPIWWASYNGLGKITWTATLEPGKRVELDYAWQYYWR